MADNKESSKKHFLSDAQRKRLVAQLNQSIDIPIATEKHEEKIIESLIEPFDLHMIPAMHTFMPPDMVELICIFLSDSVPLQDKKRRIYDILQARMKTPLATYIHEHNNSRLIPDKMELGLYHQIVEKCLNVAVENAITDAQYI